MADNWLERKMDDYRSGRGAASAGRRATAAPRHGHLSVPFPPRRVLVTDGTTPLAREIIKAFREAGCTVTFFGTDRRDGNATAQATGSRFIPADSTDCDAMSAAVTKEIDMRGDIDILINISPDTPQKRTAAACAVTQLCGHRLKSGLGANTYGRILNISHSDGHLHEFSTSLEPSAAPLGFTVNTITVSPHTPAAAVTRLCTYLAEPAADIINGHLFNA